MAKTKKISQPAKSKSALAKKAPAKKSKMAAPKKAAKKVAKKAMPKAKPKMAAKTKTKTNAKTVKTKTATPPAQKTLVKSLAKPTTKPVVKSTVDYSKAVTPLGDRLVVRVVTGERMTAGGLYIPDTVSNVQGHFKGEVLAAGTGARNKKGNKRPLDVTVGDQIYFDQYSATKINFGTEELHIVKETDVLGVAQ